MFPLGFISLNDIWQEFFLKKRKIWRELYTSLAPKRPIIYLWQIIKIANANEAN